ncbi:MAG: hypothetical protein WB626_10285 [Bacteroidota bacterium]
MTASGTGSPTPASAQGTIPPAALARCFAAAPPGKLFCLHGNTRGVFRLSLYAASSVLRRGIPVALVDGTNRFDLYYLAGIARRMAGGRVRPEDLLRNIHVARAFTCYQMEATITERLPAFVERTGAPVAVVFGLLDTFYDDQAPFFEVRHSVRRILAALDALRRRNVAVLLASRDVKPASVERRSLFPALAGRMDEVFMLTAGEAGTALTRARALHPGREA